MHLAYCINYASEVQVKLISSNNLSQTYWNTCLETVCLSQQFSQAKSPQVEFFLFIKVPLWSNSRYPFFLRFPIQKVFPSYLGKFQSITNIRTHVFWTFISDSLRPPLIFIVPSLDWELEKMTSYSQKYHTGWTYNNNVENCTKICPKVFVILYANCFANCY